MGIFSGIYDIVTEPFRLIGNLFSGAWDMASSTVEGAFDGGWAGTKWGAGIGAIGAAALAYFSPDSLRALGQFVHIDLLGPGAVSAGDLPLIAMGGAMLGAGTGSVVGAGLGTVTGALSSGWRTLVSLIPFGGSSPAESPEVAANTPAPARQPQIAQADAITPTQTPVNKAGRAAAATQTP